MELVVAVKSGAEVAMVAVNASMALVAVAELKGNWRQRQQQQW